MTMKLSKNELLMLGDLSQGLIGPTSINTGRTWVAVCEGLVKLGLASAHRTSIGELDEKATYRITVAGCAERESHQGLKRIDRIDSRGDIREHVMHPTKEQTTLCGLSVRASQPTAGNRRCTNCERLMRSS
jgi:hypothetical protein